MNAPQKHTVIAVAIAALFTSHAAFADEAQKTDKQLKEVEVVGTSPLPGLGIEKDKLPYDVQTATDEQLYQSQTLNLAEYMSRNFLGVNINDIQGSPFQADITYRGFRLSGILGSSQGLSVYLDGVRVNEPFGDIVNWDMIPEVAINNAILVPGSNPIYGLNTLGGALAFTTKSGLTAPGTELKLQAGSFGRVRADVAHGSKSEDGYHSFISATGFRENGWRDYSSGNLGNVFAKIGRQQGDSNWDLSLLVGRSNLLGNGLLPSTDYGDEGVNASNPSGHMYERNHRSVYTHPDRTQNELSQLVFSLQRMLDSSTELATTAYVRNSKRRALNGDAELDGGIFEAVLNRNSTSQTSYGLSSNFTRISDIHQVTVGASIDASQMKYGSTSADECDFNNSTRGVGSNCNPAEDTAKVSGKSLALGLYASDTLRLSDRTHLTGAARFNHARVSNNLTSYFSFDRVNDEYNRTGGVAQPKEAWNYNSFNPSLGISHRLTDAVSVFGNIGQSNRVPTIIELGCADEANPCQLPTGLQADPYLKQVIARTLEFGTRTKLSEDSGISVAVYRSENTNDILFRQVIDDDVPLGAGYFKNFSKTRRQGLDVSGYTQVGQFSLIATYSYLDATYQDSADLFAGERNVAIRPGMKIAGLPEHTLRLNLDWRVAPKWTVGGTVLATSSITTQGNEDGYIGEGEPDDWHRANAKIKGYTLLHLHTNYEVRKGFDYFARINNVLDQRFATYGQMAESAFLANGTRADLSGASSTINRFVAPGAPRSFMVGMRYRF